MISWFPLATGEIRRRMLSLLVLHLVLCQFLQNRCSLRLPFASSVTSGWMLEFLVTVAVTFLLVLLVFMYTVVLGLFVLPVVVLLVSEIFKLLRLISNKENYDYLFSPGDVLVVSVPDEISENGVFEPTLMILLQSVKKCVQNCSKTLIFQQFLFIPWSFRFEPLSLVVPRRCH